MEASPEERRHLTVLSCDIIYSPSLAGKLALENFREVIRTYQAACADAIERFDGHLAQYLGDYILFYFGYPRAHEDVARRVVHAALAILDAVRHIAPRLTNSQRVPITVRIGIHTGLGVVGEISAGGVSEQLAPSETPNVASRILALAGPGTSPAIAATKAPRPRI